MSVKITGRASHAIQVAVDPALRSLAHEVCAREGVELSDVLRGAMVSFLREKGVDVEFQQPRRGRPRKVQMEAVAA